MSAQAEPAPRPPLVALQDMASWQVIEEFRATVAALAGTDEPERKRTLAKRADGLEEEINRRLAW